MPRRSRLRRITKWIGVVVCVLLVIGWVASWFGSVLWQSDDRLRHLSLDSGGGVLGVVWGLRRHAPGFHAWLHEGTWNQWTLSYDVVGSFGSVSVPYWIPFLLAALPTGILFHRDRRRPGPGCCQACGYDLTGNVSGVCPECGIKV